MIRYDLDELRKRVSAKEVAERELGARVSGNRCAAVWRQGKNPNVEFFADGCFRDYKTDDHGGPASLLAVARGISLEDAANELGDKYCPDLNRAKKRKKPSAPPPARKTAVPKPPGSSVSLSNLLSGVTISAAPPRNRYEVLLSEGFERVADYHYHNEAGEIAYTVVRMERDGEGGRRKEFLQKTDSGWGLRNVQPVLYNLPEVLAAGKVYVVEGEKDADFMRDRGFVATTCSGGAGKWQADFSKILHGKSIVIIGDNDDKGHLHAECIARQLYGQAASLKLIFPSPDEKGDVTDFFLAGGSNADFAALERDTPEYRPPRPGVVTEDMLKVAKDANQHPFKNYRIVTINNNQAFEPVDVGTMLTDLDQRLLGYPYKLGNNILFDHDKDTREIYEISSKDQFYEWLQRKMKVNYCWKTGVGFVTKPEFYESRRATARRFESISDVPDFPENDDVYYTFSGLPPPSAGHQAFEEFLDFFCPAFPWYRTMLKTFIAAPMWFRRSCSRPSWVIDSISGTKVGKTTLAEVIADLYCCSPIRLSRRDIDNHPEEIYKRLLSSSGRKSKIVLVDNVVGEFHNEVLADCITARTLSGRAPYSAGEDQRPNNITWVITSNGARLNTDLTGRSFFISLRRPTENLGRWNDLVNRFLEKNRMQIFADVFNILSRHKPFEVPTATRHAEFEREVLQAMCDDVEDYQQVIGHLRESKESANVELDECHQLIDCIRANLADISGINPASDCVWIYSDLFKAWTQDLFDRRITCQDCRKFAREGMTLHFDQNLDRFRRSSSNDLRRSGVMWLGENADRRRAKIVGLFRKAPIQKGEVDYENDKSSDP